MKISMGSVMLAFVLLLVVQSACTLTPGPAPATPEAPPATLASTAEPAATATSVPSPTLEPTVAPTNIPFPQQWNGTYTYNQGAKQGISLLIEKVDGVTFTGKMIWNSFGSNKGAILRMNGEYVTDFGDEVEQTKWNNLEDYRNGEEGGAWLKWTETEIIDGRNYTVNGWYYAHIREDGTMVAVYFFNDTEVVADNGKFALKQVLP